MSVQTLHTILFKFIKKRSENEIYILLLGLYPFVWWHHRPFPIASGQSQTDARLRTVMVITSTPFERAAGYRKGK